MRQAETDYLQEEGRLRGARPRVKAVLYPFELDYGLAPGSGEYLNTCYGGAPGKLALAAGYYTSASWTSPVVPAFSPDLDSVFASWEDQAAQMDVQVYLRSGETAAAVSGTAYAAVIPGQEVNAAPYFQLRVEFTQNIRSWAVYQSGEADAFTAYAVDAAPDAGFESYGAEGESSGCLANLCLEGRLALPESEIIDPGSVEVDLAWDFSELRAGSHVLVLDHRQGQWLNRAAASYLPGLDSVRKQVDLYHGWELPGGDQHSVRADVVHQEDLRMIEAEFVADQVDRAVEQVVDVMERRGFAAHARRDVHVARIAPLLRFQFLLERFHAPADALEGVHQLPNFVVSNSLKRGRKRLAGAGCSGCFIP